MPLFIGCPVWSFKGWVGNFYPPGTKPSAYLKEYSLRLTAIEANTTFYAVPESRTITGWINDTPEQFLFCPKLPRAVSHHGRLPDNKSRVREFVDRMKDLGSRLGPMFLQLPPAFSPNLFEDLEQFLEDWPAGFRLAVEVRHRDWFQSTHHTKLTGLLNRLRMAQVILDTRPIRRLAPRLFPGSDAYDPHLDNPDFLGSPSGSRRSIDKFIFLRFVGHPRRQFNSTFLQAWVERLAPHLENGEDIFVFCHSPDPRFAPYIGRLLHRMVAERVPLTQLPWDGSENNTYLQGELF